MMDREKNQKPSRGLGGCGYSCSPMRLGEWLVTYRLFLGVGAVVWLFLALPSLMVLVHEAYRKSSGMVPLHVYILTTTPALSVTAASLLTLATGVMIPLGCFVHQKGGGKMGAMTLVGATIAFLGLALLPQIMWAHFPAYGHIAWGQQIASAFLWLWVVAVGSVSPFLALAATLIMMPVHGAPFILLGVGFVLMHSSQREHVGGALRAAATAYLFVITLVLFLGAYYAHWALVSPKISPKPILGAFLSVQLSPPWMLSEIVIAVVSALVMLACVWYSRSLYLLCEWVGIAALEGMFFFMAAAQPSAQSLRKPVLIMAGAIALWVLVRGVLCRKPQVWAAGLGMTVLTLGAWMLWLTGKVI